MAAPLTEQSGVGHSITYLTPLMARKVFNDTGNQRGWAVEGSPADCVKLAVSELCPQRPDLVVSGINSGLNAGINVLYSGTVAAAIEGAFFGITSVAVSLEYDEHARYDQAAQQAVAIIQQVLAQQEPESHLFNLNIPSAALDEQAEVHVVPVATAPWGDDFEKRRDPRGRKYYWATGLQPDLEIARILHEAAEQAETILNTHRSNLQKLTEALLEREVLDYDEIEELIGPSIHKSEKSGSGSAVDAATVQTKHDNPHNPKNS